MKVLCLILARSGSLRLKNKNFRKINGKSLFEKTLYFAKKCKFIKKIYLSTNDEFLINKYKNIVLIPWKRPNKYSNSKSSSNSAIIHFLRWYKKKVKKKLNIILLLQPTSPFRNLETFKKALFLLKKNMKCSVVGISPIKFNKNSKNKIIIDNKQYFVNGSLYLSSIKYFLKYKSFFSKKTLYIIQKTKRESIDIDTKKDLIKARLLA